MSAAEAAVDRASARRRHDPSAPYLVPPIAAGHRDPIVRALVETLSTLYVRRGALRQALLGRMGDVVFPAFPELLARPPKRVGSGEPPPYESPDFSRRRSDGMEAIVRVILVLAACCDWTTMEIKDPQGGYLSVWRIAELADLPFHLVAPRGDDDRRRRFRQDTVERVLRTLRAARIISYTKQHRDQLPNGRHTTTAPALRKLAVSFFRKFGGSLLKTFDWRRSRLKGRAANAERSRFRAGHNVDLRLASELTNLMRTQGTAVPLAPVVAVSRPHPRQGSVWVPDDVTDSIHAENPHWSIAEIFAEARRRSAQGQAPPPGTLSEPSQVK